MLTIIVTGEELYDEKNNRFIKALDKPVTIVMEHSLVALDKWESHYKKPFLHSDKTDEEILYYFKCMTITQNVPMTVYEHLSVENIQEIQHYIEDSRSATFFSNVQGHKQPGGQQIVTSELIYYWMIAHNIPTSWEKKHINKLLTLIRICNDKNAPPKKISKQEQLRRNAELVAQRRAKYKTKG
jgi:hypothetical protein